jgi:excisionase family DNA binding protein
MPETKLYTIEELAALLSVHPETIRNWIRSGQLQAINLGGAAGYRVSQADLDEFLAKRRGRPAKDDTPES